MKLLWRAGLLGLDRKGNAMRPPTYLSVHEDTLLSSGRGYGNHALVPNEQRVDRALENILAAKSWTRPQRRCLHKTAEQTKANLIVDRGAPHDPDLVLKRASGGFARLDRTFGGEVQQVLDSLKDSLWPAAA